jgi:hypothetical protein
MPDFILYSSCLILPSPHGTGSSSKIFWMLFRRFFPRPRLRRFSAIGAAYLKKRHRKTIQTPQFTIFTGMIFWLSFATTCIADTWSITPNPAFVNENAGSLTFTVTRSDSSTATTVYASTVHDQGYSNSGYYVGVLNQAVNFSIGQTTAQVTVTINDLGLPNHSPNWIISTRGVLP